MVWLSIVQLVQTHRCTQPDPIPFGIPKGLEYQRVPQSLGAIELLIAELAGRQQLGILLECPHVKDNRLCVGKATDGVVTTGQVDLVTEGIGS